MLFRILRELGRPQPFCPICVKYLTPEQARRHNKHARAIKWPK
jgi:hypothetical protein